MKYFVEFEFKTEIGNYYWFPLFINAQNIDQAEVSAKTVQTALEQHYTLNRRTRVGPAIEGINSEIFKEYVNKRISGKVEILEFNVWRFKDIKTVPELNFDEHLELINYGDKLSEKTIVSTLERHKYPVRLYNSDPKKDFKDFLIVNVVDPSNVE